MSREISICDTRGAVRIKSSTCFLLNDCGTTETWVVIVDSSLKLVVVSDTSLDEQLCLCDQGQADNIYITVVPLPLLPRGQVLALHQPPAARNLLRHQDAVLQ